MAATPVSIITGEVSGLGDDLLTLGALGVGVSAGLFALAKGWRVVTRFIR